MEINSIQKFIKEVEKYTTEIGIDYCYDNNYNFYWKINNELILVVLINSLDDIDNKVRAEYKYKKIIYISNNIGCNHNIWTINELKRLKDIKEIINDDSVFNKIINIYFDENNISKYLDLVEEYYLKNKEFKKSKTDCYEEDKSIIKGIIESYFKKEFNKKGKYLISNDGVTSVLIMESKVYNRPSYKYWYTYHSYQKEELKKYKESYIFLYFKDKQIGLVIEEKFINDYLELLNKTVNGDSIGWHIHIQEKNGEYSMRLPKKGLANIDNQLKNEERINTDNTEEVIKLSSTFKVIKAKH